MKIRNGFVSNSSSSSFICDFCREEISGWDMYPEFRCENGHQACEDCSSDLEELTLEQKTEIVKKYCEREIAYYSDMSVATWLTESERENRKAEYYKMLADDVVDVFDEIEFDDDHPAEQCPICQLRIYDESEMCLYLYKKYGVSRDDIFARVKAENKRRRKLYDSEYISIVCRDNSTSTEELLKEIREVFGTWNKFNAYLAGE